ncbi:MAG TPA: response regulator [Candidatus Polarisedimenticolia bacterium]|jgi:CheY-like chemotaxis protein
MYKILLADDVKLTLASEKAYLEGRNLKVFATSSASEAREMAGVLQPDLVVLDYEMPEMTGAEVCRELRDNPQTAHIPVLILSIRDDAEIVRICEEAGAVGFLRKADGREALLESVARVLGVPRRRHLRMACEYTVGIVEGGRTHTGVIQNVSASGMFLTAARNFESGMALRLRFSLPGLAEEIHVLGEVVRKEDISEEEFGFGIQFLELTAESRQALVTFLENSI